MKNFLPSIWITALLTVGVIFSQTTETIYLKSGDKITGEIIKESDQSLILKTPYGNITIAKENIQPEKVNIWLKNGDILRGTLSHETPDTLFLKTSIGLLSIPSTDVDRLEFERKKTAIKSTVSGVQPTVPERWYFSEEQLMDIWFDPTGFTLERGTFYLSPLTWAFGFSNRIQLSTSFWNYFWGDFNVRPKIALIANGDIQKRRSLSIGGHVHTRGLPSKYRWEKDAEVWYEYIPDQQGNLDSIQYKQDGWVSIGAQRNENEEYQVFTEADQPWGEVFIAFTRSTLRDQGNGRVGITLGASAIYYPDVEILPRAYLALDMDLTRHLKVMAELAYDPYHVPWYQLINDEKSDIPVHYDLGFLTNQIPLFGSNTDNLWIGFHFQQPFFTLYWKL